MQNKVYNTLGLATRARLLVTGESVLKAIQNKSAHLVIIANDASDNTKKRYINKCEFYEVPYFIYGTSDEISKSIGKSNRMTVGIIDKGFANKLIDTLRRLSDGKEEYKEEFKSKKEELFKQ